MLVLLTSCSPAPGYRITVENRSERSIDEFLLQLDGETVTLGKLQPGDRISKRLNLRKAGSIGYRFKMGENCLSGPLEQKVIPGGRGDATLVIEPGGRIRIIDNIRHTEVEKPAEEWALPCMIPG